MTGGEAISAVIAAILLIWFLRLLLKIAGRPVQKVYVDNSAAQQHTQPQYVPVPYPMFVPYPMGMMPSDDSAHSEVDAELAEMANQYNRHFDH